MPSMNVLPETNLLVQVEAQVSLTPPKMGHLRPHSRKHNTDREKETKEHMLNL
jgi:hypothetical protein